MKQTTPRREVLNVTLDPMTIARIKAHRAAHGFTSVSLAIEHLVLCGLDAFDRGECHRNAVTIPPVGDDRLPDS